MIPYTPPIPTPCIVLKTIRENIDLLKPQNKIATVNINKKEIIIFLAPYNSYNFPVIGEQIAAVKAAPEKIHE